MSIPKENDQTDKRQPWLLYFLNIMYSVSTKITISCLVVMVALVVFDVCGRSLLGSGMPGTVEINEYLLIILGFVGIIQTHHTRGHVGVCPRLTVTRKLLRQLGTGTHDLNRRMRIQHNITVVTES